MSPTTDNADRHGAVILKKVNSINNFLLNHFISSA